MRTEDLYDAIHAVPFRPFSVILPSGGRMHLHHPEFAALPPGKRSVSLYPRGEGGVRVLDVAILAGIEYDVNPPRGVRGRPTIVDLAGRRAGGAGDCMGNPRC